MNEIKRIEFYYIHSFICEAIFIENYKANKNYAIAIQLTSLGKQYLDEINENSNKFTDSEIKLALLIQFHLGDFLIDFEKSDLKLLIETINAELKFGYLKYPFIFERVLYDKYFKNFDPYIQSLSSAETQFLLSDTSQGIFQYGQFISGPFGILKGQQFRDVPITLSIPLWHCNDISCNALHLVDLESNYKKTNIKIIEYSLSDSYDLPEDFILLANKNKHIDNDYYSYNNLDDLPYLIIDSFTVNELKIILKKLIDDNSKEIRSLLPDKLKTGSSQSIVEELNKTECFQLILLMPNLKIIYAIEYLIYSSYIKIPTTELRCNRYKYKRSYSYFNLAMECSQFGIRVIDIREGFALIRLKLLINFIYEDKLELEWKLRLSVGKNIEEKLDHYIHSEDLIKIIRDIVFVSPTNLEKAKSHLEFGYFFVPKTSTEEDMLIKKILWKLGFDIKNFPILQMTFWERLNKLKQSVQSIESYSEKEHENVRSIAVNFFVSLEEVLDLILAFVTWLLLSDHTNTMLLFNLQKSREFMALQLNNAQQESSNKIKYDSNGRNTLYPLIEGFNILMDTCEYLIRNRENFYKTEKDLPNYASKNNFYIFPFYHTSFILDISKNECDSIVKQLKNFSKVLTKDKVCDIRNRIEHKRNDFPTREEILKACASIEDIILEWEEIGLYPLTYLRTGSFTDSYNRGYTVLSNYKGRQIKIYNNSQFSPTNLPNLDLPQIIVPFLKLRNSNEAIRFYYNEPSEYLNIWKEYPKRKHASETNKE